jgi:hypothetical protein
MAADSISDSLCSVYVAVSEGEFSRILSCVGNFSPAMGARNQVGIGLSYRPASLCSLATQFQTRFLESILRPIAGLKFSTLIYVQYTQVKWSLVFVNIFALIIEIAAIFRLLLVFLCVLGCQCKHIIELALKLFVS